MDLCKLKTPGLKNLIAEKASSVRARFLARTVWLVLSFWSRSIRVRLVNREVPEKLTAEGKNFIYAFFHGDLFPHIYSYRDSGVLIPASESRDGEIMARLLMHYGFSVVRGSSKRKGDKALLALVHGVRRGKTVAIAVDGPRGLFMRSSRGRSFWQGLQKCPSSPLRFPANAIGCLKRAGTGSKYPFRSASAWRGTAIRSM